MQCPKCQAQVAESARHCRKCRRSLELALLQVIEGPLPTAAYLLGPRTYTIGRAEECDVSLPDPSVSRVHARLAYEDDRYFIEDHRSRHGILLDGRKVRREELRPGSEVRLGSITLRFRRLDRDASTAEGLAIPKARLTRTASSGDAAAAALDRLRIGVVLVSADGSVLLANRAAQAMLDGDGLGLGPTGLRAEDPATARELRRLLGGAAGTTPERGGAMAVLRVSRRPLALLVTPLGRDAGHVEHPRAVKAVFISDPERGIETGEESLRHLYGLTPAEARLVVELHPVLLRPMAPTLRPSTPWKACAGVPHSPEGTG